VFSWFNFRFPRLNCPACWLAASTLPRASKLAAYAALNLRRPDCSTPPTAYGGGKFSFHASSRPHPWKRRRFRACKTPDSASSRQGRLFGFPNASIRAGSASSSRSSLWKVWRGFADIAETLMLAFVSQAKCPPARPLPQRSRRSRRHVIADAAVAFEDELHGRNDIIQKFAVVAHEQQRA